MSAKPGFISDEDVAFATEVLGMAPGSFLGGSYVVKGRDARDIDVVIPHRVWREVRGRLSGRITKVRKDIPTEEEDIGEQGDERLITVYRRGAVDLLVIRDEYVPAYTKAVEAMIADPEAYAERDARVRIHVFYADQYRKERGLPTEKELIATHGPRSGRAGDYR